MRRRFPRLSEFGRIAVIQTAYLGDVALTLPLLEALRQLHPTARRVLVTRPAAAELARCAAAVDEVVVFDKHGADAGIAGLRHCAQRLRQQGVELVLTPHRSLRTALLVLLAAPRYAVGSSRSALRWVYDVCIPYGWHLHEVERNLQLLSPFADVGEQWRSFARLPVELRIAEHAVAEVEEALRRHGVELSAPLVVLAPGSAWATKRWSTRHYAELARLLRAEGYAVVLTGSAAEGDMCREIAQSSGACSLAGELSIAALLSLFRRARCVVCNDSAPVHLAELVGTPVVALFGPTLPQFGFAPRLPASRVLEHRLPCRPCSVHGGQRCPLGTHACLEGISPREVWEQVRLFLR